MSYVHLFMNKIDKLKPLYQKHGFTLETSIKSTFAPAVIVRIECDDLKVYCAIGTYEISSESNVEQFKQVPTILNKFKRIVKQLNLPKDTLYRFDTTTKDFQPTITFKVPTSTEPVQVIVKFHPDTLSVFAIECSTQLYQYTSECEVQMDKTAPTLIISANDESDFDITLRNNIFFNKDNKYTTKSAVRFIQNFKHTLSQLIYYSN